jgi:hypothetical protein
MYLIQIFESMTWYKARGVWTKDVDEAMKFDSSEAVSFHLSHNSLSLSCQPIHVNDAMIMYLMSQ